MSAQVAHEDGIIRFPGRIAGSVVVESQGRQSASSQSVGEMAVRTVDGHHHGLRMPSWRSDGEVANVGMLTKLVMLNDGSSRVI